ncbi:MAG: hemerythrin domain-containing protein [Zoogloeaceae bacterium]|nr:hemerythrin domain-containing protein [Zoogloeaceae bacterium]
MKRATFLLDLSREHHTALALAHRVRKALKIGDGLELLEIGQDVTAGFESELLPHFSKEEFELLPFLLACGEVELVERTRAEHRGLTRMATEIARAVAAGGDEGLESHLVNFAEMLVAHVRFEERQLFERAQDLAVDDDRVFS